MPIEDVFTISGRGTVVTGRVERGKLPVNSNVEIVGIRPTQTTTVTSIETFHKQMDEAEAARAVLLAATSADTALARSSDLAETARVMLLPPRQPIQLPSHLQCRQVVPLLSLLDGLARILLRQPQFDVNEQQAIQGRSLNELAAAWDRVLPGGPTTWSPDGIDVEPLLDVVRNWHVSLVEQVTDVFCTAIHWSSRRLVDYLRRDLPQSQPVGQILLAGPARVHGFIAHVLTQQLPGIDVMRADDFGVTSECWEAIAAAILAMLHVDQVPANTYALTGVETPRVLGRISPGPPCNWHGVLADMARTLPEKMTLRSAI